MRTLRLDGQHDTEIVLDLCFACHGIWFDRRENLLLSPDGVLTLFRTLHAHRDDPQLPLKEHMACPRCRQTLVRGTDRTISGAYTVHRCPRQHGHFSTFPAFMVEKGFVRPLAPAEVQALARTLRVIHCSSCGAPVDLRQHHACPYCRSAFSLLDPDAVTQAMQRYQERSKQQARAAQVGTLGEKALPAEARASLTLARHQAGYLQEKHRQREQMERWREGSVPGSPPFMDELWSWGLSLLWRTLRRLW